MKHVWVLSGMMVALAGLEANPTEMAMASTPPLYDALAAFGPDAAEDRDLAQLSDKQLASIIGGEASNPLQTLRLSVPEASKGIVNQNFTYVPTGLADQSSSSHSNMTTTVESGGRNVTVEQTQTSFQTNNPQQNTTSPGNQATNGQLQGLPQVVHVTVTPQADGSTRIVIQQGGGTSTTLLPFRVSPEVLLRSVPFQALVSVGQNVVQNIHHLSAPMLGNPSVVLRTH
jgi:bacteriocin-like protein